MSGAPMTDPKRVLVIEDDAVLSGALKLLLEWEGYQVDCAENGQDALDCLSTNGPPAVILLDLLMPVLSGWGFREEQQRNPALASIPVVVVSAVEDSACVGADAFL